MRTFAKSMKNVRFLLLSITLLSGPINLAAADPGPSFHTFTLTQDGTAASYDEALAVACVQGIMNRDKPELYVLSKTRTRPQFWLDIMSREGRWLQGRPMEACGDLDALVSLAGDRIKGVIIWDDAVPATMNVATTLAGVMDGIALSPALAASRLPAWKLPVLKDLRGQFTGAETGSAKNDAYRWAWREFLAKGACSSRFACFFEDSFGMRERGELRYVVTRDWAVRQRSFVFDLSPWGDEAPSDDPGQKLGTDLETLKMIFAEFEIQAAGRHFTEVNGFFNFIKYSNVPGHASKHEPVPTEWEYVWLMSPHNCYHNTLTSDCFNQSFHSHAPRHPLVQERKARPIEIENKTYLCVLMADYDSGTTVYEFLPDRWPDAARGTLPLAWGVNPNLLDTYPDLIAYYYSTATPADTFTADAGAAGYINPGRIKPEHLPLFTRHNQGYFREADMTLAPMVLDWDAPSAAVKDAFTAFAPDGYATIIMDFHQSGGQGVQPHVWKGMPVMELINDAGNFANADEAAAQMSTAITNRGSKEPAFHIFRIVWTTPGNIVATLDRLKKLRPELDIELLDPLTFFAAFKHHQESITPRN